ncbi:SPOSA6832_04608 [Sporobolomyces salmonicolor]|uniref:Dol-P-Glc:Glc(2)Man(9)GlcNAc(2)-PP-Dol alpha-1,2-glucosyltransferase n=1 Tax=Sporidiobolus salmonicolor TaxID=5005 RepID=A0A0D6ESL0_SPOSA|nr:SPOSA6832_04608 [Sporobolomyces salmonicolor]
MPAGLYYSAYIAWAAGIIAVARRVNSDVREPYMDEVFHVPQAQAYCRGDWGYWDPAITTPPGLYLTPALLSHLQRLLPSSLDLDVCSLPALRAFNLLILLALPRLYTSLILAIRRPSLSTPSTSKSSSHSPNGSTASQAGKATQDQANWEGLVLALMPAVGWWAWLFYTDLGSIATVLLAFRLALGRKYVLSTLGRVKALMSGTARQLGAVSLLYRQTNIVWLAFVAGGAAVQELRLAAEKTGTKPGQEGFRDPRLAHARWRDLLLTPLTLVTLVLRHILSVVPVFAAYLPVFSAAVVFVLWNGGIVLGDKANHIPSIHIAQVYYFVAFSAVFVAPHVLDVEEVGRAVGGLVGSRRRTCVSLAALGGMCWTIKNYTIAHPFLLADNRHFAFYLWRRLINVHPLARYALAPGYLIAAQLLYRALGEPFPASLPQPEGRFARLLAHAPNVPAARAGSIRLSTFLLFVGATSAVLIPTPLIEPRYFLTPFILLRLFLSPGSLASPAVRRRHKIVLVLEAALYVAVQAICVWLFLERGFQWDVRVGADGKGLEGRDEREVGKTQRIMY